MVGQTLPSPPRSFLSEHHLSPSGAFQSPLVAVLVGLDKGCQFPPLSGWLDVNGHCPVGQWWGLESGVSGHRGKGKGEGGGTEEPTAPVAELEGWLACLDLSHPNAGSSPMPAQPAAEAQLKLPRLLFRARPTPVAPSTD